MRPIDLAEGAFTNSKWLFELRLPINGCAHSKNENDRNRGYDNFVPLLALDCIWHKNAFVRDIINELGGLFLFRIIKTMLSVVLSVWILQRI